MHTTLKSAIARTSAPRFSPLGVRGAGPGELDAAFAHDLGKALGQWVSAQAETAIMVGRDMRMSSVSLSAALQAGARAAGIKVYDAGLCSEPVLHFGGHLLDCPVTVYVGAGRDAALGDAIEIAHDGSPLDALQWTALRERLGAAPASDPRPGGYAPVALRDCYIARLLCEIPSLTGLRVAIDAGNGTAGLTAPALFRALGCEVTELFCEPDDAFPHHPPEPSDTRYLQDLRYCLRYAEVDLGLAFDAAGRRVTILTRDDTVIGAEQQMILVARDLLETHAGARVLFDATGSRRVAQAVHDAGGLAIPTTPGRAGMRERMQAHGALLAGDASGHLFFADRWYGTADGFYAAARLLDIASRGNDPATVLGALPRSFATPEWLAGTGNTDPRDLLRALAERSAFTGARQDLDVNAWRADYADGFCVARSADDTDGLLFRFAADSPQALDRIQTTFRREWRRVAPRLQLPF